MTRNGAMVLVAALAGWGAGGVLGYPGGYAVAAVCGALLLLGLPVRPWPGSAPMRIGLDVTPLTAERGATVVVEVAAPVDAQVRVGGTLLESGRPWTSPELPRGRHVFTVDRVFVIGPLALWRRPVPFEAAASSWASASVPASTSVSVSGSASVSAEVTICPRHVELTTPPEAVSVDEDGDAARVAAGTGAAFAGLREYEPGDDLRRIDWAASARSADGDVYVRQFAPARTDELVVVLDPSPADDPAVFEVAVDLAYSFVLAGADLALDGDPEPMRGPAGARDALIGLKPRTTAGDPARPGAPRDPLQRGPAGDPVRAVVGGGSFRPAGPFGAAAAAVITTSAARVDELRHRHGDGTPIVVAGRDLAVAAKPWTR